MLNGRQFLKNKSSFKQCYGVYLLASQVRPKCAKSCILGQKYKPDIEKTPGFPLAWNFSAQKHRFFKNSLSLYPFL
jgi:hypothetical protein